MHASCPHQDWDPTDPAVAADYVGAISALRERCPVAWSDAFGGFWSVATFEGIAQVCRDHATFGSAEQFVVPNLDLGIPWLPLQSDPPAHGSYRRALAPLLTKSRTTQLEPEIRKAAVDLLEPLVSKERFDASADFAQQFAGQALCIALGFPVSFRSRFIAWNADITRAFREVDIPLLQGVLADISGYVAEESERRRKEPGDDVMSRLVEVRVDGRELTQTEIVGYYLLLMSAGHDTSSNSLGHALVHLAENPEHRARLRAQPELLPNAVEEIIRYYAPLLALARRATTDVDFGGRHIKQGDAVALLWVAASHDRSQFPDADVFKLDRPISKHLSFGLGTHYCVGAELGRLQLRIAIEEFLRAFDDFEVAGETIRTSWPTNGYLSIPMTAKPALQLTSTD